MKVKTSVTLSEELLKRIDCRAEGNRSEWIERIVRAHLRDLERAERDASDAAVFARLAESGEAESDVMDYTASIAFGEDDAAG